MNFQKSLSGMMNRMKSGFRRHSRKKRKGRRVRYTVIFIVSIFLFAEIMGASISGSESLARTMTYFGFFEDHQEFLDEKNQRLNSPDILNETQERLDQMVSDTIHPITSISDFSVETHGVPALDPDGQAPPILDASARSTIWNKSTVLEFLIDRPLAYVIMTFYENETTFTNGMLRQTLVLPWSDFGTDWGWHEIDVDNDPSTGVGPQGVEIKARMRFRVEEVTLPTLGEVLLNILDPPPVIIEGSLVLEVEKLITTDLPLEIYFAKYASYEGRNFIVSMGNRFDNTPSSYTGSTRITKIILDNLGQNALRNLINRVVGNITTANLAEISGPYSVLYNSSDDLKYMEVVISMIRIENMTLVDWTWAKMTFRNKPGLDSIPRSGELWLNNTVLYAPIDTIIWNAGPFNDYDKIRFLYSIEYFETRENLIYAIGEIEDMPPYFKLAMDYTQRVDGKNITILDYEAGEVVDRIEYHTYEFPFYKTNGNIVDYNVSHVLFRDLPLRFSFEVTSDVGRNLNDTIQRDPDAGLMANLIDNIIVRMARRFYRIGESLKTLSTSITTLPQRKGWAELTVDEGAIGLISLFRSSGLYITMDNDFISFLNETHEEYPGFLVDFPIAGRLVDIKYMEANFKNDTKITMKREAGTLFTIIFVDGEDFAFAEFKDLPDEVTITVTDNMNTFASYCIDDDGNIGNCDFSSPEAKAKRIDRFRFLSRSGQQYMELQIKDIPNYMTMKHLGKSIIFNTLESEFVGSFEFFITNNSNHAIPKLNRDHYGFIDIQPEYSSASGRLSGLQFLHYNPVKGGRTELILQNETEFDIRMINNYENSINAQIILDPLPSHFSMELPGAINSSIKRFPDVINITGEVDFSNVVFAIANLGNDIIEILKSMSQNVVELVGALSSNLSFTYNLEGYGSTLDIIASIEKGSNELLPDLSWSHGIIMAAEEIDGETALKGNIYLQGLPTHGNFSSRFGEDEMYLNLVFNDYRPKYDWLYVERNGLQARNLNFYIDKLRSGLDINLEVNLSTNMTIGGKVDGMIIVECTDSETGKGVNLGSLHVNLHRFGESDTVTEVFISEIPSTFQVDISVFKDSFISYAADSNVKFLYVDIAKKVRGGWHNSFLLFHDLPTWFEVNIRANPNYEIQKPLPMQGMPELEISSGSQTMDIIVKSSGRASGQRGNTYLEIENVNSLYTKPRGDKYKITSAGLDYLFLQMSDLPMMENFKINKLELIGEHLHSMELGISTLFGVYPIFEISELEGGAIEFQIEHELDIFGSRRKASVALVDITYTDLGRVELPSETPVSRNGISFEMDASKRHVLIPAPFSSLLLTSFNN